MRATLSPSPMLIWVLPLTTRALKSVERRRKPWPPPMLMLKFLPMVYAPPTPFCVTDELLIAALLTATLPPTVVGPVRVTLAAELMVRSPPMVALLTVTEALPEELE